MVVVKEFSDFFRTFNPMKQKVIDYAIKVFGTKEAAEQWLEKENLAIGNKKPISLLENDRGCEQVLDILARIEDEIMSNHW